MKSNWFPIFVIVALLGLLVLLAALQYQWLGQISEAEQTRLEARLKDDTKRFAEDFNKEIQNANLLFHPTSEDWDSFGERYETWTNGSDYTNLIKDFYYFKTGNENEFSAFNKKSGKFESASWTDELRELEKDFGNKNKFAQFNEKYFALTLPVLKSNEDVKKIFGNRKKSILLKRSKGKLISENIIGSSINKPDIETIVRQFKIPETDGFLIVKLDEDVIRNEMLPALVKKYFSDSDSGSYKVSVFGKSKTPIYQTHNEKLENMDAEAKLFSLSPANVWIFRERNLRKRDTNGSSKRLVITNSVSTMTTRETISDNPAEARENVQVEIGSVSSKPRVRLIEESGIHSDGIWTLGVQHTDGSLEQFISNTRRRNLVISFGILSLLGVSIILIFLSSQRAKMLAERQMNFVSSVSHEFRTPLAVIYSAGENLSDGIVEEGERISDYGTLIKREGKKLTGMVEQILEFAGANSGKLKYDFRETNVERIINEALEECKPFIEENDFEIKVNINENLPKIYGDERALTQAVQNLISNSLKYSNGSKLVKVSAVNGDGILKIVVEDEGIGISDRDQRQIFEPFYRSEKVVDEQISGNGLGLSLVKQIVDAHGGKIEVESEIGKGSKFVIHLPLNI